MTIETIKKKYIIDDTLVWVREHTIVREIHLNNICPLCRDTIEKGEKCKFVVNNYILFPNCFVHSECFDTKSPQESLDWLCKDYKDYLKIIKMYECWG